MKNKFNLVLFLFSLLNLPSCKEKATTAGNNNPTVNTSEDVHTYARPSEAVVKHLSLDLAVDFDSRKISGTASYDIEVHEGADSIRLDTRELDIHSIKVDSKETPFKLGPDDKLLGQSLSIPVNNKSKTIIIDYSTRPGADALQWLNPSQTAGKQHPYLFTQGEAILTRTW